MGICGLGTVGGGTFTLLKSKESELSRRLGKTLRVTHVGSRRQNPKIDMGDCTFSTDIFAVVQDPEVDIVIETLGGMEPALSIILQAIENGKHVVTANKALIAIHGNQIFEAAKRNGVTVAYESAVAGGIPIIKALREGLAANSIQWLAGIINGTGNFILTEMAQHGRTFADVLAEAQELGYAEADPTFDVEGIDAAHKLTILAANAFGIDLQFDKVYTEGISKLTTADVQYAEELGYVIKHLGIARMSANGVEMRVHPTLISDQRLIAKVNGVMNAVVVKGDSVGSTLYYGPGAGAEATASSVVADVIDIVRGAGDASNNNAAVPSLAFESLRKDVNMLAIEEIACGFYLRIPARDEIGVMAQLSQVLTDYGINIEALIQKEPDEEAEGTTIVPVVMLTGKVSEKRMNEAIAAIEELNQVAGKVTRIRVELFDGEDD
ncbi:MAG: homoserine dehydrogenase [Pseudohongiellaceae bacterium]|nr:homoserine dehydrogenase [Pseudohongiellaceae bacterium]